MPSPSIPTRSETARRDSGVSRAPLLVLSMIVALLPGCATIEPFSGQSVDVAVESLLHAIGEAAKLSSSRSADLSEFELTEIEVTLETIAERDDGGELTLWIVTVDADRDTKLTQKVIVLLEPTHEAAKKGTTSEDESASGHKKMVERLAKGFDLAYLAARGAKKGLELSGSTDSHLATSKIAVEIDFTVTGTAEGFPTVDVLGVDLTLGDDETRENVHGVKLVFEDKTVSKSSSEKTS